MCVSYAFMYSLARHNQRCLPVRLRRLLMHQRRVFFHAQHGIWVILAAVILFLVLLVWLFLVLLVLFPTMVRG